MARLLHRGQGHLSIRLLGVLRCARGFARFSKHHVNARTNTEATPHRIHNT